ncbi:ATP-dependent DNA helicase PIF6 [Trichonephila clavipes]|nr:ATP-dependent DNA helicase PIF6 [Trichonephila clavipes]
MSEDILHRLRAANQNSDIQFTPNVYNEALILIEDIFLTIANKALVQLGMPASNRPANNLFDRDLQRETHYDSDELGTFVRTNLPHLIIEQRIAYDRIMRAITEQSGGLFFIDAPGGTGKTFLLSLILATIRSQNNIALVIASSGIAATLLDGGRTTHSALKLPLNLQNTEAPTCNISKNSGMGKVLQTCQIIIWDECTMSHKKALEALDRTLRDFRGNRRIFGGALISLSGDFRQTLPIIPRSTPAEELHACLKSSVLWPAKNIDVNTINFTIQHGIPSETTTYKSIDTVENQDEVGNYPTEFLNSLDLPGMPPHVLTLKIGVPIILLRNINPPRLCNGTRLSVKKMMNNVIEATILTGKFKGEDVLLPRIPMIPTDMPFEFKRLQFPVRLAFAITINKAQGQSLQLCGLYLENPCFSHGQLYVACSRVGKPSDLFVYAPDGKTRNIVYPTALI